MTKQELEITETAKKLWKIGVDAVAKSNGFMDSRTWNDLNEHQRSGWLALAKYVLGQKR